jgi:hypothetical protein
MEAMLGRSYRSKTRIRVVPFVLCFGDGETKCTQAVLKHRQKNLKLLFKL